MSHVRRSRISGVGSFVPANIVKNNDLKEILDTSDEWIRQRTGIEERRWVRDDETVATSDLALRAAEDALAAAKVSKSDLDLIIFATLSADHEFPGAGCFLQAKLGIPGVPALDIRQQCSGFLYGLSIADQFIRNGQYKNILVVGAEIHSRGLDKTPKSRDVTVLFGDGAGAAVVSACDVQDLKTESCILSTHLHADGVFAKELWTAAPGVAFAPQRISAEQLERGDHFPKMNGKLVFVHASKRMVEVIEECLNYNQTPIEAVDLFIFHQANLRINEMVAKQLNVPDSKVFNTIQKYANTTAATIPLGLTDAVREGKLKPGMLVASAAFGSGFTWASALMRW